MLWKKWPYWLRGGIICGGIFVLLLVVIYSILFGTPEEPDWSWSLLFQLVNLSLFPSSPILERLFPSMERLFPSMVENTRAFQAFNFVVFFITGSLIGGIIGLFKNKKSPPLK
ncbi:MAG: hypothetical protein A3G59_01550 [Candidatus Taylorbacteria bacterium RIFCSPLOWO2_12_FULL_47_20]|uniref:Uncharacterized protein n=1 Tax=Candidatus Taylorbacteria bacterium RIFCSPLOWO2_12_FULL_47_20 TaxID=1802335 RepID=A0A1G2P6S8_9BACT|nr:MAG: hypothetical protein A3G59_01550 [Candidatus Taylorbacteria bacterium RIFCSPLOWO2_12_FULL_47_20]